MSHAARILSHAKILGGEVDEYGICVAGGSRVGRLSIDSLVSYHRVNDMMASIFPSGHRLTDVVRTSHLGQVYCSPLDKITLDKILPPTRINYLTYLNPYDINHKGFNCQYIQTGLIQHYFS